MTAPFVLPSALPTASAPAITHFRGSIAHPTRLLCTLRPRRCHRRRNTHYQAGATPYLGRTCTGWIAPASPGAPEVGLTAATARRVRTRVASSGWLRAGRVGLAGAFHRCTAALAMVSRAIAAGTSSGIAKQELTLISQRKYVSSPDAIRGAVEKVRIPDDRQPRTIDPLVPPSSAAPILVPFWPGGAGTPRHPARA